MACVAEYNVCRRRGDTHAEVFQLKLNGVAHDITGDSFLLSVATIPDPPDDTTELFQLVGTLVTPATGIFSFAPAANQPVDPGVYFYDIQWTDSGGEIRTVLVGTWTVEQDITK